MTSITDFDASMHLHEGWRVQEYRAHHLMHLEQDASEIRRRMRSQFWVVAISALAGGYGAFALLGHTSELWDFALWPMSVLMLGVAALGLRAMFQSNRWLKTGIKLVFDGTQKKAYGLPLASTELTTSGPPMTSQECDIQDIESVVLRVFAAPKAQQPARAEIIVRVRKQPQGWRGPVFLAFDGKEDSAHDGLLPLALALAGVARCAVQVNYVDSNESEHYTKDEIENASLEEPLSES